MVDPVSSGPRSGCGCLVALFSMAIFGVAVYEIQSWRLTVVCTFTRPYC